jgi:hypothetical protein
MKKYFWLTLTKKLLIKKLTKKVKKKRKRKKISKKINYIKLKFFRFKHLIGR